MNQDRQNPEDESLSRVLREWKVQVSLPPRFQEQVWRRIDHREEQAPAWRAALKRFTDALARPALATSYVGILLAAGLLAGYWQARVTRSHNEEAMGARYVQMMDPYQRSHH
jgi:hypothetical protein